MTELASIAPPRLVDPLAIKPEMTLGEILTLMQANDEGLADLTIAEMEELRQKAELKVDGYQQVLEDLELEELRLANRVKAFQAAKKTVEGKIKHLKALAVFHMQRNKFKRLKGEDYKVDLRTSRSVRVKAEPTAMNYVKYCDYMRLKYEWDRNKIKEGLKKSDPVAQEIGEIEESFSAVFSVNKGRADD